MIVCTQGYYRFPVIPVETGIFVIPVEMRIFVIPAEAGIFVIPAEAGIQPCILMLLSWVMTAVYLIIIQQAGFPPTWE
jgi:hypothetical protein